MVAPFAVKSAMNEVVRMTTVLSVSRGDINDVAFVIPLHEVEGGNVNLAGASNTFFI